MGTAITEKYDRKAMIIIPERLGRKQQQYPALSSFIGGIVFESMSIDYASLFPASKLKLLMSLT